MNHNFFQTGLCFHCDIAQKELSEFNHFHNETESLWKDKDKSVQDKLNKILEKYPIEHHQEIIESHAWELHKNQSKYPDIHRESLVITIYSFLEDQLNELCSIFSESIDTNISLKDLKGNGIDRTFLYLKKVACLNFNNLNNEVSYIRNINRLRNMIVHNGGYLPEQNNDKLNVFISNSDYLFGAPCQTVTISSNFVRDIIANLVEFFEKLNAEVQDFIQRYNA